MHLYKALVRPLLEYPIIPNGLSSDTVLLEMQRVQNKNLKLASAYSDLRDLSFQEIHEHFDIDPINIRFYNAVDKLWTKMELKEPAIHQQSTAENNNIFSDHRWWKRTALYLERRIPDPIGVSS